jgi:hypothetical protein
MLQALTFLVRMTTEKARTEDRGAPGCRQKFPGHRCSAVRSYRFCDLSCRKPVSASWRGQSIAAAEIATWSNIQQMRDEANGKWSRKKVVSYLLTRPTLPIALFVMQAWANSGRETTMLG